LKCIVYKIRSKFITKDKRAIEALGFIAI
jgi:hypothetical protein